MLFAVRETGDSHRFGGLPSLTIEGLTDDDARALVTSAVPGHLDEKVRDRLVAETRGNPLALLDLPKAMVPGELAGGFVNPSSQPVSGQLHYSYLRRLRALPEPTQRLMLLAAADPTGDTTLLWRAAHTLNIARDAADQADHEQLLEIGSQVRFRHPLVRTAAYASGTEEERGAAHIALANATDDELDHERRVWHLAAAATGPDELVAIELERTASAAHARAGLAAAAAFLERAFALTEDASQRLDRGLAAATANLQAGALNQAKSLVAESAAGELDDLQQARVEQLSGRIEAARRPQSEAPLRLLETAKRLERLDPALARDTYLEAWWPGLLAGHLAVPGGQLTDICEAALAAPWPPVPRPWDLLLEGLATAVVHGHTAAAPVLRSMIKQSMTDQVRASEDLVEVGDLCHRRRLHPVGLPGLGRTDRASDHPGTRVRGAVLADHPPQRRGERRHVAW